MLDRRGDALRIMTHNKSSFQCPIFLLTCACCDLHMEPAYGPRTNIVPKRQHLPIGLRHRCCLRRLLSCRLHQGLQLRCGRNLAAKRGAA